MSGALPVDFVQIEAWVRLRRLELQDWELAALLAMDREIRRFLRERADETVSPENTISQRPLTAELFDALFP